MDEKLITDPINDKKTNNGTSGMNAGTSAGGTATGTAVTAASPLSNQYDQYTADTINKIYDAQKENYLNQLNTAYQTNLASAEQARDRISGNYQDSLNALSAEYERTRHNTNEGIAANGLNTGTGSQAALAQWSEYQRDFGNVRKSESEALANAEQGIQNIKTQYQSDVASALANNDYERATALLSQYKDNYNKELQKAETSAAYGDFSGYVNLYGAETATQMQNAWYVQNPDLAYMTGRITADQRDNIMNGRPINDGLDATGMRVGGSVSNGGGGDPWGYGGSGWNPDNSSQTAYVVNLAKEQGKDVGASLLNAHNNGDVSYSDYLYYKDR